MTTETQTNSGGLWSAVASIVETGVGAAGMFSPKVRENQLAIAEANARANEANAAVVSNGPENKIFGIEKKHLFIGIAILILAIVLYFIFKNPK